MMKDDAKFDGLNSVVFVNGWPLGLAENVTSENFTSINDSTPAQYECCNSSNPIYILRDGKLNLPA
ncbi:MAG: hypothetical protein AABX24_00930 [Nanoarchaeota archaeon]